MNFSDSSAWSLGAFENRGHIAVRSRAESLPISFAFLTIIRCTSTGKKAYEFYFISWSVFDLAIFSQYFLPLRYSL